MGMGKWLSYLRNVASLSPVPKDMKFGEVPQGVRVLGGTYAVDGDEVCLSLPVGLSYYTHETPKPKPAPSLAWTFLTPEPSPNSSLPAPKQVVFSHMDEVPGATPEIEAVLRSVGA